MAVQPLRACYVILHWEREQDIMSPRAATQWGVCLQNKILGYLSQVYLFARVTLGGGFPKMHVSSHSLCTHSQNGLWRYNVQGFLHHVNQTSVTRKQQRSVFHFSFPQTVGKSSLPFKVTFCLFKNIPAVFMVLRHSPANTLDKWIGNILGAVGEHRLDLAIISSFVFVGFDQDIRIELLTIKTCAWRGVRFDHILACLHNA